MIVNENNDVFCNKCFINMSVQTSKMKHNFYRKCYSNFSLVIKLSVLQSFVIAVPFYLNQHIFYFAALICSFFTYFSNSRQ